MKATATAHANIALVKYWGKRDDALLLPQAGSLSIALDKLLTTTTVELGSAQDSLELDGKPATAGELPRAPARLPPAGIPQSPRIPPPNTPPPSPRLAPRPRS